MINCSNNTMGSIRKCQQIKIDYKVQTIYKIDLYDLFTKFKFMKNLKMALESSYRLWLKIPEK